MFKKGTWLLCFTAWVLIDAGSPEISRDSFFRLLDKRYSGVQGPWSHRPREDFYRHEPRGISHGHSSQPYESTLKATEISSEHPAYSSSSQASWWLGSFDSNSTGAGHYVYSRTRPGYATVGGGLSHQDLRQRSHSAWYRHPYRHQQVIPAAPGHVVVKMTPAKGNVRLQSFDASGKSKYKKTSLRSTPTGHQNAAYPRVHGPYVEGEHPARQTVHPLRGRYYPSPYQRYAIPSWQVPRYKVKAQSEDREEESTASPMPISDGHLTTERMDDAYPEGSSPSEDYSAYGDARHKSDGNYYESYEEVERTTSGPGESQYDESTTRGYYGDRIYMSAQVPLVSSEKTAVKNKYFIVRRTSDDDIETIFE